MKYKIIIILIVLFNFILISCIDNSANPTWNNSTTVTIGSQVWMLRNLDVDHYRNGDLIPEVKDQKAWTNLTTGAWCYYYNESYYTRGKLYNWYAVNDPRGLAPKGWHIPSETEWSKLADYLGGKDIAGGKLKTANSWKTPNEGATNETSFFALPGGYRDNYTGRFDGDWSNGWWWSSNEYDQISAMYMGLSSGSAGMGQSNLEKGYGFSVRCLQGEALPGLNPLKLISIKPDTAFIGDEVTLTGIGFGSSQGTNKVTFTGLDAVDYANWRNAEIKVILPEGCKSGKVSITVNGVMSNELDFTIKLETFDEVRIGNQVCSKKNLNVDHYRNGDSIPEITDPTEWVHLKTGAWCYYENNKKLGKEFGKLYNWYAVNDPRGLAPEGWHVSNDNEWTILVDFLGGDQLAGGKLKEKGYSHWSGANIYSTNVSGFSAFGGGYRDIDGAFIDLWKSGRWWSTTDHNLPYAWLRFLTSDFSNIYISYNFKEIGYSVRCVRD